MHPILSHHPVVLPSRADLDDDSDEDMDISLLSLMGLWEQPIVLV
jgi:hypothetical protein